MAREPRPPKWNRFDLWVLVGAGIGLVVAAPAFCLVSRILVGNWHLISNLRGQETTPTKILSITGTLLGAFTIGGAAVMQYRKHKFGEYQSKLDEDAKTGDRLRSAVEHLGQGKIGDDNDHIRLGAVYEFKNLTEDSPRNRANAVQILTQFIKKYTPEEGKALPPDIEAAAKVLAEWIREDIEARARVARIWRWVKRSLLQKNLYLISNPLFASLPPSYAKSAMDWKYKWLLHGIYQDIIATVSSGKK
ncbi:MAG: hypothetical protein LBJ11_09570 [Oscillospiraceae bacterium]|nr:hypothetical protein [Oscillospiraceae bacterium]